MNVRSTSLNCLTRGLLGRPTGTQNPSHSGRDLKTQSTKSSLAQGIRNTLRSLQGKFIGLRSRYGSWVDLKRRVGTSTSKQEQLCSSVAEISMAKPPLLGSDDEQR